MSIKSEDSELNDREEEEFNVRKRKKFKRLDKSLSSSLLATEKPKKSRNWSQFGPCRVCNDKASGVHYGIESCEGCKAFFKRSYKSPPDYVCKRDNKCSMTLKERKKCKSCRWTRCLLVGMSPQGIKMGRIPNSQKKSLADSGREVGEEQPCTSEQAAERESEEVSTESVKKLIDNNNNFQLEESGVDDDDKLSVVTTLSSSSLESLNSLVAVKQHSSTSRSSSPPAITLQKLIQITCSRLANADIVPSTSYAKRCINTPMESSLVFLSLLRDKSYQLFIEDDMTRQSEYNKAQVLIKHRITEFEGHDATLPQVVAAYVEKMYLNFRQWLKYLNELPGFDQIPRCDINVLMKQNFITIYGLFCSKLFINGEYYHVLPGGIIFSRKWIEKVFGLELTDWSFDYQKDLKKLALSDSEMSLFLPYIFTNPYNEDELTKRAEIKKINEFYHRALLNEFSLNRRTKQFQANVKKFVDDLPQIISSLNDRVLNTDDGPEGQG